MAAAPSRVAAMSASSTRGAGEPAISGRGDTAAMGMDEQHLAGAYRHMNLNPVRARLVVRAEDRPWLSARALFAPRPARQCFFCFAALALYIRGPRTWEGAADERKR